MQEIFNINELVLLINKISKKCRIAKRTAQVSDEISNNDKFFLVTNKLKEIVNKKQYYIVGVDNSYFEHDDFFYFNLNEVLKAEGILCDFFRIENLDKIMEYSNKNSVKSNSDIKKLLNKFIDRKEFRGPFPDKLTSQNAKYIENKINNDYLNENQFGDDEEYSISM